MKWVTRTPLADSSPLACLKLGRVLEALLDQLGIHTPEEAEAFMQPRLRELDDPFHITGMEAAVTRIIAALDAGERMCIVGDYDVDGVTSTALLADVLQQLGAKPDYIVPRRLEEGYGLSQAAIDRVLQDYDPQLLLVLDCGTNSVEEVCYLAEKSVDVVIVDHHQPKAEGLPTCVLINPHVHDCPTAPWYDFCTVGLVFKLAHALIKRLREQGFEKAHAVDVKSLLELVAMGTVADMVPLRGENRTLTRHGLERLSQTHCAGIRALLRVSGVSEGQPLQPSDISFRLGPRINASGRLADATLPVGMLLEKDFDCCMDAALELEDLNCERQSIERAMVEEAEGIVTDDDDSEEAVVLFNDQWHPGVVGIVAGKLSRELNRPCVVLGCEDGLAKGSGRSIHGVNLVEALSACAQYLESWGGHPMAAGVSLPREHVSAFRKAFRKAVHAQLEQGMPEAELEIALWLEPSEISEQLFNQVDHLRPFGQQNPQPVFGLRAVVLEQQAQIFAKKHLRLYIPCAMGRLQAVAWKMHKRIPPHDQPIDLAFRIGWNHWNGRCYPQAEILDWRAGV